MYIFSYKLFKRPLSTVYRSDGAVLFLVKLIKNSRN